MRKNFLFKAAMICLMSVSLVSCKKDKDEDPQLQANEVTDPNGILTSINWTANSGMSTDIDLDMYLYKGTGANKVETPYYSDDENTSQELFTMPVTLADGEYTLAIDFWDVPSNGMVTFGFSPSSAGQPGAAGSYNINNVSFLSSWDGTERDMVKIVKSGTKFTITQL